MKVNIKDTDSPFKIGFVKYPFSSGKKNWCQKGLRYGGPILLKKATFYRKKKQV